jgi:hypothetical protein
MEEYKDIEKMTKKERKEYYARFRNEWEFNPTTRYERNKKAKKRKEERERLRDEWED